MSPPPPWSERLVPIGQEIARLQIPPSCASLISSHSSLILPTQVSITLFNISSFYRHGHLVRKLILRGYSTRRKGRTTEGWAPGIRCVLGRYGEVPGGQPCRQKARCKADRRMPKNCSRLIRASEKSQPFPMRQRAGLSLEGSVSADQPEYEKRLGSVDPWRRPTH
jgi:hypothetical protein